MREIKICPTKSELIRTAAERFVALAEWSIEARGRFAVALSGGSTPRSLYTLLAVQPFMSQVDWTHVHVFWGDERAVPPRAEAVDPARSQGLAGPVLAGQQDGDVRLRRDGDEPGDLGDRFAAADQHRRLKRARLRSPHI